MADSVEQTLATNRDSGQMLLDFYVDKVNADASARKADQIKNKLVQLRSKLAVVDKMRKDLATKARRTKDVAAQKKIVDDLAKLKLKRDLLARHVKAAYQQLKDKVM